MSRVVFSNVPGTPPVIPLLSHLNTLVNTLNDAPQDDVKFQALKEISDNLEELYGTPSYAALMESLIRVFMKLLQEMAPQFIAENNTLQLRKLMLELLYRMSANEMIKAYSKSLQPILLRLINSENEDNALLIIKILTDHIKNTRPPFISELTTFFAQWKVAYSEMFVHTERVEMFLQMPIVSNNGTIEESVQEALKTCYANSTLNLQTLNHSQQSSTESECPSYQKYTLIPKATQSVKVLAEMSVFLLVLIQSHRQHLLGEVLDFVPIFARYINILIPRHIREDKTYNRELVDEFHTSQVRAVTFIAFMTKQTQVAEIVDEHSASVTKGILMLLDSFHDEVVNQRRELLMAIKYLFQSDFKSKFISIIPKMFDEKALLGASFTSQDQLRNQANSFLADILHHVRMNLDELLLLHVYFICSRNLHDQQLLPYVQTMYAKLMMNLIEPLMVQPNESAKQLQRKVLCNAIDSFLRKAQSISEHHLPLIFEKFRNIQQQQPGTQVTNEQQQQQKTNMDSKQSGSDSKHVAASQSTSTEDAAEPLYASEKAAKHATAFEASQAFWQDPMSPFSLADCKGMVRWSIQPVKMMVIALKELGIQQEPAYLQMVEKMLMSLFSHGLKCLDVFMVGTNALPGSVVGGPGYSPQKHNLSTNIRSKEEKDTIEAFIAIFTSVDAEIFEKILQEHIEFLVERININPVLQNVCNTFFTHPHTMKKMVVVLVKFLLTKLPELGANNERAALYLKLFKLVFQAISYSSNSTDCDSILKPFLNGIVQDSMHLAFFSRESTNYFLLMRALFRSIGSGTHDHLYQQFLPLLPSILQQLNRLQNDAHRQAIHELFVELCLTVPVRLSSLLPYLPLLMDPLVSALNGTPSIVQQGLRTLELCVDNLQPDYFYDHMQPVRAALMKGLWRTISQGETQSALVATRILGKFGGSNRKVLLDAHAIPQRQKLPRRHQNILLNDSNTPKVLFTFAKKKQPTTTTADEQQQVTVAQMEHLMLTDEQQQQELSPITGSFGIEKLMQNSVMILKTNSPDYNNGQPSKSAAKVQAAEFIKTFLLCHIQTMPDKDAYFQAIKTAAGHGMKPTGTRSTFSTDQCQQSCSEQMLTLALNGLFIAVFNIETRAQFVPFFRIFIKHMIFQAILETSDILQTEKSFSNSRILVDAIALTLADSCKDYCHTAVLALRLLFETTATLVEVNKEQACQHPLFSYMVEKITALCYRREWFARLGGCTALRLIIEHYPKKFVEANALKFLDACIEIISLSKEISSGAHDFASNTMDLLVKACFQAEEEPNLELLEHFILHLVDRIDDPEPILREECIRILCSLSNQTNIQLFNLLQLSKDLLFAKFGNLHQFPCLSMSSKLALIDVYLFCSTVERSSFRLPKKDYEIFATNLLNICYQLDDSNSLKDNGINSATNTNQIDDEKQTQAFKKSSIKLFVVLYSAELMQAGNTEDDRLSGKIFEYLITTALESPNEELKQEAVAGIAKINSLVHNQSQQQQQHMDQRLVHLLTDFRERKQFISEVFFDKLAFIAQYSSQAIPLNDLQQINDDLSLVMQTESASIKTSDVKCSFSAIRLFHLAGFREPSSLNNLFNFLSNSIATVSSKIYISWLDSVMPFLCESSETLAKLILTRKVFQDDNMSSFVLLLISAKEATRLRGTLLQNLHLIHSLVDELFALEELQNESNKFELNILKFLSILFQKELVDANEYSDMFTAIRSLWTSNSFQQRHSVRKILPSSPSSADGSTAVEDGSNKMLDDSNFDCPVYCATILLGRLRTLLRNSSQEKEPEGLHTDKDTMIMEECVDLLYELTFVFVHSYASDFSFLRKFISTEVIPEFPLAWRRATFTKVIRLLNEDPKNGHSMHLVRFMQYVVAPLFAYAFQIYETDLVVGMTAPTSTNSAEQQKEEQPQQNTIVAILSKEIIQRLTNDRSLLGHSLTIVMYLFCSLLVQNCSMHIYDPAKKQPQGGRQEQGSLRHFMLFGWPCLQQSFQGDLTEKYAGHFLIANIIDKFSINRTIILQVLTSLMQAHHQDNKDLIRKSLDILIPAVPRRMPDGYSQLQALLKKVMVEECRNSAQIVHCLQIVVRHHKVFYHIRLQIAQLILGSLQRLSSTQAGFETKRLLLETCEVIIKWEQERQALVAEGGEDNSQEQQQIGGTERESNASEASMPSAPDLHKKMDKHFLENFIVFLFRITTSMEQFAGSHSGSSASAIEYNRRAINLLRNALKPNAFGTPLNIRTNFLEKQLQLPNPEQFNAGNENAINHQLQMVVHTLDVLANLINNLAPQSILDLFRPLQRSLVACMSYSTSQQILRGTYSILSRLLDKTKSSATGLDNFEVLNQHIARIIHDTFNNYANTLTSSPPMTIITLLRLMHTSQPTYLETVCLNPFVKLLQRLVRECVFTHGAGTIDQSQKLIGDLLAICLEVLCTRIQHFNLDAQKTVVQSVLIPLAEKNPQERLLEISIKISSELVASEVSLLTNGGNNVGHQGKYPSQGAQVLIKLFATLEPILASNQDLQRLFLHSLLPLFENQDLFTTSLSRMQHSFYWGLCSSDRNIRMRYFNVFERNFPKGIFDRIVYILSKENWELMGGHFWLTHVVHLIMLAEESQQQKFQITDCPTFANVLPQILAQLPPTMVQQMDDKEAEEEVIKMEGIEQQQTTTSQHEDQEQMIEAEQRQSGTEAIEGMGMEIAAAAEQSSSPIRTSFSEGTPIPNGAEESTAISNNNNNRQTSLEKAVHEIQSSLRPLAEETNFLRLTESLLDVIHLDKSLCNSVFVELFSSILKHFESGERDQIALLVPAFLTSAMMTTQRDSKWPVVASFLEAFVCCDLTTKLDPFVLNYVGETYNCWHIALLQLEKLARGISLAGDASLLNPTELVEDKLEVLDSLAKLYQFLSEFDQYSSVWRKRAYFDKTIKCLAFYQQGDFVKAREMAEKLFAQLNEKLAKASSPSDAFFNGISPAIQAEVQAFSNCWINSCKQLNDWTALETYSNSEEVSNPACLMESAWHLNDWELLKDCLVQVDAAGNPQTYIKSNLLKLMLNIANFNQQEHRLNKELTEKVFVNINRTLISTWKKLSITVSHSHLKILNHAHLTHEIYEAANVLHSNLQSVNFPSNNGSNNLNLAVKHLMKSWNSRSLTYVDQLSSWLDLFTWRAQFFHGILQFYESTDQRTAIPFPIHALAQNQLQLARELRHSNQIDLALGELNKLHSSMLLHTVDVQQKLVEHIKCLLKLSSGDASSSSSRKISSQDALVEALDMIEGAQANLLKKEQLSRLMVCKGVLLSKLDKREEAGRAFSAAAQLDHTEMLGGSASVWKHWGEFLTNIFMSNPIESSALSSGVQSIACTLEHARMVTPVKARASIAKLLWLIKITSSSCSSSSAAEKVSHAVEEQLNNYVDLIPPNNWMFWLSSIVADVQQRPSESMLAILKNLAKAHPQHVFYLLRMGLGPKETSERIQYWITKQQQQLQNGMDTSGPGSNGIVGGTSDQRRLTAVLDQICAQKLVDIEALNKIMNALDNFPTLPLESLLYELKQILSQCHFNQFMKIAELTAVQVDTGTLQRLEICCRSYKHLMVESGANEQSEEENIYTEMMEDFKFLGNRPQPILLHKLASALRKWIPVICQRLESSLGKRQRRLVDLGDCLSRFKCSMARIDVFEGYFDSRPRLSLCNAQISQFLPIYERYIKDESVCRLIRIRSLNGKIYSYQLERVPHDPAKIQILQLFSLLNNEFAKSRSTAQRLIQFAIPHILFTGLNTRLIQCCPLAGISAQSQNANSDFASYNFILFTDILNEMLNKEEEVNSSQVSPKRRLSNLAIIEHYYGKLAEQRYSHKTIHELFNQISTGDAETATHKIAQGSGGGGIAVPKSLLARWMNSRYSDAESFWTARKKLALHFALLGLCEHTFFLTSMTPDALTLDISTAQIFFTEYKFDLTKKVCETLARKVRFIELDANRPVPFRLTSNITHFLDASIDGHFTGALTAISRTFNAKSLEVWLRPILWDQFSSAAKGAEEDPQMNIVNPVKRAVDTILNRVKLISHFENGIGATSQLLMQAQLPDNLCRMDPSWHPWF